jgi:hypothetical protein
MVSMIGESVYQFFVMKIYVAAKLVKTFPSPYSFLALSLSHTHTPWRNTTDDDEGETRRNSLERWLMNFINCGRVFLCAQFSFCLLKFFSLALL